MYALRRGLLNCEYTLRWGYVLLQKINPALFSSTAINFNTDLIII